MEPAMGMFEVKVKLANLAAPGRSEEVSLLVDTGATLSWIPRKILQGEEAVLGTTALEGLGFLVDSVAKRLIPRDLLAL
jgi:hypothetical protein